MAPEVPGVCQELPPGLRVLGGPQVARGDLLSGRDGEPRPDLDQALLWVVLTDRVTPRNTTIEVYLSLLASPYMQEWLRRACMG